VILVLFWLIPITSQDFPPDQELLNRTLPFSMNLVLFHHSVTTFCPRRQMVSVIRPADKGEGQRFSPYSLLRLDKELRFEIVSRPCSTDFLSSLGYRIHNDLRCGDDTNRFPGGQHFFGNQMLKPRSVYIQPKRRKFFQFTRDANDQEPDHMWICSVPIYICARS
jgi:hypothetical protein